MGRSKKTSTVRKKTNKVKKFSAKDYEAKKQNPIVNEITGIAIIAFSIMIEIFIISKNAGKVGVILRNFIFSLFGVGAYIMPVLVFLYGITVIKEKAVQIVKPKMAYFAMVIISFVTVDHIFYQAFSNVPWNYDMNFIYNQSLMGKGGGFIGGIIAITLYKMFYVYGAAIVSITAFIAFSMMAADISVLKGIGKIIKFFLNKKNSIRESKLNNSNHNQSEIAGTIMNELQDNPEKHDFIAPTIGFGDKNNSDIKNDNDVEPIKIVGEKTDNKINILAPILEGKDVEGKETEVKKTKKGKEPIEEMKIDYANSDEPLKEYVLPSIDMLNMSLKKVDGNENKELLQNAKKLEQTLESFGVNARVLQVTKGPTVTRYELQPSHGVKVSRIVNLADDIALNLAASTVRIEAPIPGKSAVGIEIPNKETRGVFLKEVIGTPEFRDSKAKLAFAVGMSIEGKPVVADISKMPHLLIAGSTGSGKSVCINTMIASVLYKSSPEEVKIIMIDPKVVELNVYNGIPHLMIPVVTDPKKAAAALNWAVQEMLNRYNLFADTGTRDIAGYNSFIQDKAKLEGDEVKVKFLPHILIIIDELADLMMAAPNEVEDAICRLAQMARAAGMHLVIATQRPSVDVITGVIKANVPSRIAFAVSSHIDSRTIIDMAGAEKLLGKGDMLFYPIGNSKPVRIQGAFISDKEVERIVDFIRSQNKTTYDENVIDEITSKASAGTSKGNNGDDADEMLPQAIQIVIETQLASISMLQRRLRVGFSRAARLIDQMEARNIVGPPEGSKPRKVLLTKEEYENLEDNK